MSNVKTKSSSEPLRSNGRLLARVLAEDTRQARDGEVRPGLVCIVTGEVRRDWSDPEFEGGEP